MKIATEIAALISRLEYEIGRECYNPNSYDGYTGVEGAAFRYPVTIYQYNIKNTFLAVFHQYREYNSNHEVVLEIGCHHEKSLGHDDILHVHIHNTPGVEHHGQADKFVIKPGHPLYERYKKLFKGVKQ